MTYLIVLPSIHPPSTERCLAGMAAPLRDRLLLVDNTERNALGHNGYWNQDVISARHCWRSPGRGRHGGVDMAKGSCSYEGCSKPNKARQLCSMHYQQWRMNQPVDGAFGTVPCVQCGEDVIRIRPTRHRLTCATCRGLTRRERNYEQRVRRVTSAVVASGGDLRKMTKGDRQCAVRLGLIPPVRGRRDERYRSNYGMTEADYDRMLADQDGRCALCRRVSERRLYVDHCHMSGRVRGLLCWSCNTMLGCLEARGVERTLRYIDGTL